MLINDLEHDEDVVFWIETLRSWLKRQREDVQVGFMDLLQGTRLPLVEAWLALLLGGFRVQQYGEFYNSTGIIVSMRR
jgi:hypothetical protein